MDKDNLDIQSILDGLTTERLQNLHTETLQQLMSALCLTLVGLFLAIIGLLGLVFKIGHLIKFTLLFAIKPIPLLFTFKKAESKAALGVTNK